MSELYTQATDYVPVTPAEIPDLYQNFRLDMPYRGEETVFYLKLTVSGLNVLVVTYGSMDDLMCLSQGSLMILEDSDLMNCWH